MVVFLNRDEVDGTAPQIRDDTPLSRSLPCIAILLDEKEYRGIHVQGVVNGVEHVAAVVQFCVLYGYGQFAKRR